MPAIPTILYEKARNNPCRELAAAVILQAVRDYYYGNSQGATAGDQEHENFTSAYRFLIGEGDSSTARDMWCAYGGIQPDALQKVITQQVHALALDDDELEEL